MKKNSVCKDCNDRHIGCHSSCEKYISETEEIKKEKNKMWKSQNIDRAVTGLEVRRIRRAKGAKE